MDGGKKVKVRSLVWPLLIQTRELTSISFYHEKGTDLKATQKWTRMRNRNNNNNEKKKIYFRPF
jgi:hypothetical protein